MSCLLGTSLTTGLPAQGVRLPAKRPAAGAAALRSTRCPGRQGSGRTAARPHAGRRGAAVAAGVPDLDDLLGSLDVPDIEADLASYQTEAGASFSADGVAVTFNNDEAALEALQRGVALADRSHWGRLRLSGEGRAAFLHGQSTADILALRPGQGCDTVFVTAQARTIDLATVLAQEGGLLLLVSPGMAATIAARLDKYIFPGDKVAVADISRQCCMLSLLGPESDAVMAGLGAAAIVGQPHGTHTLLGFAGKPVVAASGGGLAGPGYTLIMDEAVAGDLWRALAAKGAVPMGSAAWEAARVLQGRPAPGSELREEFNPLEAGLCGALSLTKGCSIGQETISKVAGLGAVKQQLWGLAVDAPVAPGEAVAGLMSGGEEVPLGAVTSAADVPGLGFRALAYLKCKSKGAQVPLEGLRVSVGGVPGRVVPLAFATREVAAGEAAGGAGGAADGDLGARSEEARRAKEEAAAAEAARQADKVRAMQERLAAWQAQQQQ